MKPIETEYGGVKFRSRTETRWAMVFDALGIEWLYEPEGFDLPVVGRYVPDFYLPGIGCWFEVKGKAPRSRVLESLNRMCKNERAKSFAAKRTHLTPK